MFFSVRRAYLRLLITGLSAKHLSPENDGGGNYINDDTMMMMTMMMIMMMIVMMW